MMKLEGADVVKYLNGYNSVRDSVLVRLTIYQPASEPVVELVFEAPSTNGSRVVKLELRDVQEFDYNYPKENRSDVVPFLKCIMTDQGDFYLSLDPYDEREKFISDKDGEFFQSRFVSLEEA